MILIEPHVPGYRADIDGLRALAVSMVILFHFWPKSLPGGFVGVDIFFVISGYLITSIMYREIVHGVFSYKTFYLRRMKRILPAFFTMLFITCGLAYFFLLPGDFISFFKSAEYSSMYYSNQYFMRTVDYFSVSSAEKPLLHTWSLAVEEQYYFGWPLLFVFFMAFSRKSSKKLFVFIFLVFLSSLAFSVYSLHHFEKMAYYSVFSRAFELMLGAITAIYVATQSAEDYQCKLKTPKFNYINILGVIGFFLIVYACIFISEKNNFPGFYALIPTVGAALIIYSGHFHGASIVNRLLKNKCLVKLGLISYSLYLFHWPVISFWHYFFAEKAPSVIVGMLMIVAVVLVSALTYRFIEVPFKRFKLSFFKCFIVYQLVPMLVVLSLSYAVTKSHGVPSRINHETYLEDHFLSESYCHNRSNANECVFGKKSQLPPKVLFFGDSHAAQFFSFFDGVANEYAFNIKMISTSSCYPLLNTVNNLPSENKKFEFPACKDQIQSITDHYNDYDVFILAGSYDEYIKGRLRPEEFDFLFELNNTVQFLTEHGKKVIIVGDIPVERSNIVTYLIRQKAVFGDTTLYKKLLKMIRMDNQTSTNNFVKTVAASHENTYFFDSYEQLFHNIKTLPVYRDVLIYKNQSHLNKSGGDLLTKDYLALPNNPLKDKLIEWGVVNGKSKMEEK